MTTKSTTLVRRPTATPTQQLRHLLDLVADGQLSPELACAAIEKHRETSAVEITVVPNGQIEPKESLLERLIKLFPGGRIKISHDERPGREQEAYEVWLDEHTGYHHPVNAKSYELREHGRGPTVEAACQVVLNLLTKTAEEKTDKADGWLRKLQGAE